MQEIVTRVLEAEKAAETRIQEARSRAGEIRARADQEVQVRIQEARERAAGRSREILAQARERARAEHEQAVDRAQGERQAFFERHGQAIDQAVEAVAALVTAPEWA